MYSTCSCARTHTHIQSWLMCQCIHECTLPLCQLVPIQATRCLSDIAVVLDDPSITTIDHARPANQSNHPTRKHRKPFLTIIFVVGALGEQSTFLTLIKILPNIPNCVSGARCFKMCYAWSQRLKLPLYGNLQEHRWKRAEVVMVLMFIFQAPLLLLHRRYTTSLKIPCQHWSKE